MYAKSLLIFLFLLFISVPLFSGIKTNQVSKKTVTRVQRKAPKAYFPFSDKKLVKALLKNADIDSKKALLESVLGVLTEHEARYRKKVKYSSVAPQMIHWLFTAAYAADPNKCPYAWHFIEMKGRSCNMLGAGDIFRENRCTIRSSSYSGTGIKCNLGEWGLNGGVMANKTLCVPLYKNLQSESGMYPSRACEVAYKAELFNTVLDDKSKIDMNQKFSDMESAVEASAVKIDSDAGLQDRYEDKLKEIVTSNSFAEKLGQTDRICNEDVNAQARAQREHCETLSDTMKFLYGERIVTEVTRKLRNKDIPEGRYIHGDPSGDAVIVTSQANSEVLVEITYPAVARIAREEQTTSVESIVDSIVERTLAAGSGNSAEGGGEGVPEVASCLPFSELPGDHYCQAKVGKTYKVMRLVKDVKSKTVVAKFFELNTAKKCYEESSQYSPVSGTGFYKSKRAAKKENVLISNNVKDSSGFEYINAMNAGDANQCGNTFFFEGEGEKLRVKKQKGFSNRCIFSNEYGNKTGEVVKSENFIPGVDLKELGYDAKGIKKITTSLNPKIIHKGRNITSSGRCYSSESVALQEAAKVLEFHPECRKLDLKFKLSDPKNASDQHSWASQKELDYDSQNYYLNLKVNNDNKRGWHDSGNAPTDYVVNHPPHGVQGGRTHRQVTDWLYGDGGVYSEKLSDYPKNQKWALIPRMKVHQSSDEFSSKVSCGPNVVSSRDGGSSSSGSGASGTSD